MIAWWQTVVSWVYQIEWQLIPIVGPVREQTAAVVPTPQFQSWPPLGELLMAFQMTDSQQVPLSVLITDKKGNPAKVDGVPQWLVDNPNVVALTPATDGLSCVVSAVGPLGTAVVTFKASANLGAGVTDLLATIDVRIVGGLASMVVITPGMPVEQS